MKTVMCESQRCPFQAAAEKFSTDVGNGTEERTGEVFIEAMMAQICSSSATRWPHSDAG